jgi:hypothetical protein
MSSAVDEDEEEPFDSQADDRDDFACVPVNNIDNDTVHIKILDDADLRTL